MPPAATHLSACDLDACRVAFANTFEGQEAHVAAIAPGRINLIGDHTDYTGGLVLPIAVDRFLAVLAAPRTDARLRVRSVAMDQTVEIDPQRRGTPADARTWPPWARYVGGVAASIATPTFRIPGADMLIVSDIAPGGGLASSAALTVAVARALLALAHADLPPLHLARLCQRVEHDYAGTPCGLMDPLVALAARPGCALRIDCAKATWQHVPLDDSRVRIVAIDSGLRHENAAGQYAQRRTECELAFEALHRLDPSIRSFRDLDLVRLGALADRVEPLLARRARHVVSENHRVAAMAEALRNGDWAEAGRLMVRSHESLRDDFQSSCPRVDRIVAAAVETPGVWGARITGGGFGGCAVALIDPDALPALLDRISRLADETRHPVPSVMPVRSSGSATTRWLT